MITNNLLSHSISRWSLSALLLVTLFGCASLTKYPEVPRVTLSDIEVVETTLLEQVYLVTVRIQNPNEHPIELRGGSFELELNGNDFGSGVTDNQVSVPAYGDAKVQVQMVSTLFGMLRLIQSFQEKEIKSLKYDISGRLAIEGSFTGLSFKEEGDLKLPKRLEKPKEL